MLEAYGVTEANWQDAHRGDAALRDLRDARRSSAGRSPRSPQDPDVARWNGQSLSSGQLAQGLRLHRPRRQPARRLALPVEVQDPGEPADVTGYR